LLIVILAAADHELFYGPNQVILAFHSPIEVKFKGFGSVYRTRWSVKASDKILTGIESKRKKPGM
jgi:hypothetical protein